MRRFLRFYFLRVIFILVVLQLGFFAWLQYRNHRPEAQPDEVNVYEGQSVSLMPLRNDTDKDKDELSIQNVSEPLQGKISRDDNLLHYVAAKGFHGTDSFAYTISDGKKESNEAFIKVRIEENLKPAANDDHAQMYPGGEILLAVLGNDSDREGDSLFIEEFSQPGHGTIEQQGNEFVYQPTGNAAMLDSFHYVISDGFHSSDQASVIIEVKDKSNPCYPFLSADIGNPAVSGGLSCNNGQYIIKASGNDIWNNSDNFHYAYQKITGDCEIISRVTSLEDSHEWAKGGIMIRESLSGHSKNAFMYVSSGNGTSFQWRPNTGSSTQSMNQEDGVKAPYWIRLVRNGDEFTGYKSADGSQWVKIGNASVSMPGQVYIGLAVTSHSDGEVCKASFRHIQVSDKY